MPFVVRDFESIVAAAVAHFSAMVADRVTDFTEGAVGRSLLETVGLEVQRLEVGTAQGVREGILTGTYRNFDFTALPATYASGLVRLSRISASEDMLVPEGQHFQVPGSSERIYEALQDVPVPAGTFQVEVPVRCLTVGRAGNTAAQTVLSVVGALQASFTVANERPFLTGLDVETEDDRAARFRLWILSWSRGTRTAIEEAARAVVLLDDDGNALERVVNATVREPFQEGAADGFMGLVEVYIDSGAGSASETLVAEVDRVLRGYRTETSEIVRGVMAAGIDLRVIGVVGVTVDVSARVRIAPGYVVSSTADGVRAAIEQYLASIPAFADVVVAEIVAAAMGVAGVTDATVLAPTANLGMGLGQRAAVGVVTVTT